MKRTLIIATLLLIAFSGCRSHRKLTRTPEPQKDTTVVVEKPVAPQTPVNPKDTIPKTDFSFTTFSGNFTCNVENFNVSGQMRIQKDKVIWLTITKLIEFGRVKLTPDSVYVHIKVNNSYFAGTWFEMSQKYRLDLDFQTVQAMLLGNTPPYPKPEVTRKVSVVRNSKKKITKTTLVNSKLREQVVCEYSDFKPYENQLLANHLNVNIQSMAYKGVVGITYNKLTFNSPVTFPLSIPKNASRL